MKIKRWKYYKIEQDGEIYGFDDMIRNFVLPFEIDPIIGEHNSENCHTCKFYLLGNTFNMEMAFDGFEDIKAFPYCCFEHKRLMDREDFDRALFKDVPEMTARKIMYLQQYIYNYHNSTNWLDDTYEYLYLVIYSFGSMPENCGDPLFLLDYFRSTMINFINGDHTNGLPEEKGKIILQLMDFIMQDGFRPNQNLKILMDIYNDWLEIFPFELNSHFSKLGEFHSKNIPVTLDRSAQKNLPSGMYRMPSKEKMIESLVNFSNIILKNLSTYYLYKNGLISNLNQTKLELVLASRKFKLDKGYKNNPTIEEPQYVTILNEWFNDERNFIDEITPLLIEIEPQQKEPKILKIKNNFDAVEINDVYKHFKMGLVDKKYLSEKELMEYLKTAFELKTTPIVRFKFKSAPKKKVMAVFYNYYIDVASKIHGKQNQYAALLGDYFEGYKTTTVSSNFSKSIY